MGIEFTVTTEIAASPERLYNAWLDSAEHSAMTGGEAIVSNEIGGEFEAWDGYIQGKNLALDPFRRIVQSWRTNDFDAEDLDSQIEILFEPVANGTQITLQHMNLPSDGAGYKQGWIDNYFDPMKEYFEG